MNLADMLSYVDIRELSRIATAYDCACNSHSKNELIQSILAAVGRKEVFERYVGELSMEDLRFLNSLLFDPRGAYSMEELTARAQMTKFPEETAETSNPREMIIKFMDRGWLFHGYSPQTRYLYQVPQDLKRRFNEVIGRKFRESLCYTGDPFVYRDESDLIVHDIEKFLRFVHEHDVPLTAELFMYKRVLGQVLEAMSVREEAVGAKGAWRFGYGRRFKEYPNRFSFIYDYCYFNGFIQEDAASLRITKEGLARLETGSKEKLPDVYRFWIRLYKGPIPNLQSIVHWIRELGRNWVTTESLCDTLCPLIRPYYYDSPRSILESRTVQMLMHLGLVAIGDSGGGQTLRVTKLGDAVISGNNISDEQAIRLQRN